MTWDASPASESRVGNPSNEVHGTGNAGVSPAAQAIGGASTAHKPLNRIVIGKRGIASDLSGDSRQVFTMSLAGEVIELLPFKNWGQLDIHKWTVQGKLPTTPAGLEVTLDHVKIAGETIPTIDPQGCEKLQRAFNEWLELETNILAAARATPKVRQPSSHSEPSKAGSTRGPHFRVELDKRGQVHISVWQAGEQAASIGLTAPGLNGLCSQGLMRKPKVLEVGALHDWVELDGELCSFEHGNNEAEKLERLLNEKYMPVVAPGAGKDILVFSNAASPTGFDIQFPVSVGGVLENKRRTLNEATLELLQEPARCTVLRPDLIIKLSPPTFIFKVKTHDGGEAYLEQTDANCVVIAGDDGREKRVDLSRPVNYSKLTVVELTAIFNHPAVNRHAKSQPAGTSAPMAMARSAEPSASIDPRPDPTCALVATPSPIRESDDSNRRAKSTPCLEPIPGIELPGAVVTQSSSVPGPNAWLKEPLAQPPIRYDWFARLLYGELAQHFGNSSQGRIGPSLVWYVTLSQTSDLDSEEFRGVFLTEKGGLGFLGRHRMARFHRDVAFVGTRQSVAEGIGVSLLAVGLQDEAMVFVVNDGYAVRFDVPEQTIALALTSLRQAGAAILSVSELLADTCPVEVLWTAPAQQANPLEPEALKSSRPVLRV